MPLNRAERTMNELSGPRIVVTRQLPGRVIDLMESVADVWMWEHNSAIPRSVLEAEIVDAAGLYCMLTDPIDRELLDAGAGLLGVSQMAVGVDNIDVTACTARGIPVGHTPGVLTETTADLALGLLLAATRRIGEGIDYVRAGRWTQWEPDMLVGRDVHGSTVGLIGYGRIGQAIARRARGFGAQVLYTNGRGEPVTGVADAFRSFDALLSESDHVVLACALTPQTRMLIDGPALARMKSTATLVNVARGPVVDTQALTEALSEGVIAAAGLDVTDPEPIPAGHPLLHLPNCVITPHIASASVRTRTHMAEMAAANLIASLHGERMPHCVNPEVYG
jgi:lactate dehydrogenase-like 2-hydroxyacid dehydrogenase